MIKANELRVGNYVIYQEDSTLFKVTEITPTGIGVINDEEETWIELEHFQPMSLIPEVLEKINWKGYIIFSFNSYFKIDDVGHLYYRSDYTGININSLHQLQNIYFNLTGQELEINF